MKVKPYIYATRIILIFVIGLICVLILEGASRLFLSDKGSRPVVPTGTTQFDELLGWSKVPLSNGISSRTGYPIEYRINSKGLRDNETTYEKPDGTFRIVLIGDSFTFGWGVPIEKHFSTLLEGYFKNVEVINMGIEAYGIDQELIYLQLEGFRYEPDLVIAYVPGLFEHRHMYTFRFGRNKPLFELIEGKLVLVNSPVQDNINTSNRARINHWFLNNSRAYNILYYGSSNPIKKITSPNQSNGQGETTQTDEQFMSELYELANAIIFAMHKDTAENGANFVLVTQVDKLHQVALDKQIYSLDVSKPLSNPAYRLPEGLLHINESGNGVLTWEISKFLQANDLIPGEHLKFKLP
jgi:hypothetical protein